MQKLARRDLMNLEDYADHRAEFRAHVMAHKKLRIVPVGPHMSLHFEDRLTVHYQVQEMLRAERIFEKAGIEEELHAYNPLIPDGANWKATMMLEYEDPGQRAAALALLKDVERRVWVRVGDGAPVFAIADEDMERANEDKTSAVHFLRFELSPADVAAAKRGAAIVVGVDHEHYRCDTGPIADAVRQCLVVDLD